MYEKNNKKWLDKHNVKLIILTHAHVDHIWNTSYIQKLYNCEVAISKKDIKHIDNKQIKTKPLNKFAKHLIKLMSFGMNKFEEYYTKTIARYVAAKTDSSCFVKIKDTNIDSNSVILDDFKEQLLNYIEENNIKLIIDIHGAKEE